MRKAFADTLVSLAEKDSRVALITGDLGFQAFDEFARKFGKRYINVGVAEAQMVYLAAGMALEGYRPIAYSIASFATARPFEQLRFCVGYHKLPVILVGAGRGYLYSNSGVSHHAGDDLGLLSLIPNMTVVAPGDPVEIKALLPQLLQLDGPAYCTVGRYGEPVFAAEEAPMLGRGRRIRSGEHTVILSVGEIANEVVHALDELKSEGIYPAAYQFHTVKPLDIERLNLFSREFKNIIVVEEHVPNGGLWAAVVQHYASASDRPIVRRLGIPDRFMLGNLKQAELRRRNGLDAPTIAKACREAVGRPKKCI
ncbi:MAG: transketolase [Deltaproteobacteria bacterium]|nr:transketolase [Deltaproteobacteria bacterium]